MIAFRVDANDKVGMGHLMRSVAIAQELKELGAQVIFVTSDLSSKVYLDSFNINSLQLNSKWDNLDGEVAQIVDVIRAKQISLLVIDSYQVTKNYLDKMIQYTTIAYIDDFANQIWPTDIIINYNVSASEQWYKRNYKEKKILVGPYYVPLRKEFRNIKINPLRFEVNDIFISTGSTDLYNFAVQFLNIALRREDTRKLRYHLIIGKYFQKIEQLQLIKEENENVYLYKNVESISTIMSKCDVAISAAGSTLYELCACGVPTITFSFADNQILPRTIFGKKNIMIDCGDFREEHETCIDNIIDAIHMLQSLVLRNTLREKGRRLVAGGEGALELAKRLKDKLETEDMNHECKHFDG